MNTKKILKDTLIIILMVFAITIAISSKNVVSAINAEDTGTITVSKVEPGLKVTVYRLATVNYDFTDDVEGPIEPPYEWVSQLKTYIDTNYNQYSDPEAFQKATKDNAGEVADFYDALAAQIRGQKLTLEDQTKTVDLDSQSVLGVPSESVNIDGLKMGTYLVLIENGYKVYRPSVVNLVPEYKDDKWSMTTPATVEIKSSDMSIKKTVDDSKVSTTDTIKYTVETDVPQYPKSALAKNYSISDKFENGLTLNDGSIQVYGLKEEAWTEITSETNAYTKKTQRPNEGGESTFTLEFTYEQIKQYTKLKVTYTAKLKTDETTVLADTGNKNTAYLDYSNNPYDAESWKNQESKVNVYTYKATIKKKDKETEEMLDGAEFTLSTDTAGSSKIKFILKSDGIYYVSNEGSASETLIVGSESANKGVLEIRGLGDGTYYLKEIKAPGGYNRLKDVVEVKVVDNNLEIDVKNDKGFVLPITGGSGTIIFTVLGTVLFGIGLLLIAIIVYRKITSKK